MTISKSAMTISSLAMAMLFGGGVYLLMNMNILAKNYIEREASRTLGVTVTLGSLDITLQEKTAKVTDLVIGNPEGFKKPYAVKVKDINVVLTSASNQLVELKDIDVGQAEVNLEVRENTTNLAAIRSRVKKPESTTAEALKVIIDKTTLSQAQIKPSAVLFTNNEENLAPVTLPDIVLTGIGQKENGVLVNDAIGQIWQAISQKIDKEALESGLLEGMNEEALNEMGLSFGQRFKENLQESVQEKVDTLGKNIDSLFNE
jgi:hypothetical protein